MTVPASVATNHFLRRWALPAEAAVRELETSEAPTHGVENWRLGAAAGAKVAHVLSSALLLPVDFIGGTLHGSARPEVKQLHKQLQQDTGGKLSPLPYKQQFLLRLEEGVLGLVYAGALRTGALLGASVGGAIGATLSAVAWIPRIASWSVGRAWGALHNTPSCPAFRTPAPSPVVAVHDGAVHGGQVGQHLGAFTLGVSTGIATFSITLTSAALKGACMGLGAGLGALWGLGQDIHANWNGSFNGQPLEKIIA